MVSRRHFFQATGLATAATAVAATATGSAASVAALAGPIDRSALLNLPEPSAQADARTAAPLAPAEGQRWVMVLRLV